MATKLFLRSTASNVTDTGYSEPLIMVTTAGSGTTTRGLNTTAGGSGLTWSTNPVWVSGRVPSGGFTLTSVNISVWLQESATSANCQGSVKIYKYTPGTPTITELGGGPFNDGVELDSMNATEMTWTANVTDTAFAENDRILVRIMIEGIGTMGGGQTCTFTFNGADAATGDSFIEIAENVTFKAEEVTGTSAIVVPLTAASTGKNEVQGTSAITVPLASAATGKNEVQGTSAITVPLTAASTGVTPISGTSAIVVPVTTAATAVSDIVGTSSIVVAPTVTSTAVVDVVGTSAITVPLTSAATGTVDIVGTSAIVVAPTAAATGVVLIQGTSSITVPVTLSGTGTGVLESIADGALVVPVTVSATGRVGIAGTGSLVVVPTASGTGQVGVSGNGSLVVVPDADGTGQVTITGTGTLTVVPSVSSTGRVQVTGTANLTIPISVSGTAIHPTLPDTGVTITLTQLEAIGGGIRASWTNEADAFGIEIQWIINGVKQESRLLPKDANYNDLHASLIQHKDKVAVSMRYYSDPLPPVIAIESYGVDSVVISVESSIYATYHELYTTVTDEFDFDNPDDFYEGELTEIELSGLDLDAPTYILLKAFNEYGASTSNEVIAIDAG
jgi:hypothetical protein